MLFISHDLAVVKNVCDTVAVMYLGKLCEQAPSETLYSAHRHPYTQALLSAIPQLNPGFQSQKITMKPGEMPSSINPPAGCRFRARCPRAKSLCIQKEPEMKEIEQNHNVACHFPK